MDLDPDPSLLAGIGIGICLLVLALTSAVDAAFTSVSWRRLNTMLADRASRSRVLAQFLQDPYRFKATLMLLNTSAILVSAALTLLVTQHFTFWAEIGALMALLLTILIISSALPKALALRDPQATVRMLAGTISRMAWLLWPLVSLVSLLTRPLGRLAHSDSVTHTPLVLAEELRSLVDAGEEEGLLEHDEREMIEGVFSFGETLVREVMVPRVYMVALDISATLDEALDTIIREGHSRIPVYDETIDNVVGVLYAKDLLPALRSSARETSLAELVRPVRFVPEAMKLDALLKELQQSKVHIAMIVDEYGGTAGLVTIEDLIEEIVGEIQDEYDVEEPFIQVLSDSEMVVDARTLIEDINDRLREEQIALALAKHEADRIGGLVYEHLGRVPRVSDEVVLENAVITVLSMKGVRPQKLRLTYQCPLSLPEPEAAPEPAPTLVGANGNGGFNGVMDGTVFEFTSDVEPNRGMRAAYATARLHRTYYRGNDRA